MPPLQGHPRSEEEIQVIILCSFVADDGAVLDLSIGNLYGDALFSQAQFTSEQLPVTASSAGYAICFQSIPRCH